MRKFTTITAAEVENKRPPTCPDCGHQMIHYGSSGGYITDGSPTRRRGPSPTARRAGR